MVSSTSPEDPLFRALALQYGFPFIGLSGLKLNPEAVSLISAATARRLQILPLKKSSSSLLVAIGRTPAAEDSRALKQETGLSLEFAIAAPAELFDAIERAYPQTS